MALSGGARAQAPDAAGRFLSITGDVAVIARDGTRRTAERSGELREGEAVVTGESALAQLRMRDGSLFSVRADSEFKLDQFAFTGKDDRNPSFAVSVLKGGFRTITGLIAQLNRQNYRISTPSATIGVRGTHFEVVHLLPQGTTSDAPAGTYNRVFEGITTVQNPGGALLQVVREQTAFASLQGGAPVLVAPPAVIFGRPTPVPRAAAPRNEERAQKGAELTPSVSPGAVSPGAIGERPPLRDPLPASALEAAPVQRAPALTTLEPAPTMDTAPSLTPIEKAPKAPTAPLTPIQSAPTLLPAQTLQPVPALTPLAPAPAIRQPLTPVHPIQQPIIQQPITTPIQQAPTTILPQLSTNNKHGTKH